MKTTSARLLRLLSLLQTPRDWTGTELAGRLEVSPRTVRNDIDRLRTLGYPVHATRPPAGGRSHTASSTPASAGTSSRGISTERTGEPSESTGSSRECHRARASRHAT